MNWENYDRLVAHLKAMDPGMFDYKNGAHLEKPSCVACQCVLLMGKHSMLDGAPGGRSLLSAYAIQCFLGVTAQEARHIWSPFEKDDPYPGTYEGPLAVKNALFRLEQVAKRYQRQPKEASVEAFLQSVRELAKEMVA